MLLRMRLFGIAVRFTVVDGSVSDVDAVGCEMASGGVTVPPPPFNARAPNELSIALREPSTRGVGVVAVSDLVPSFDEIRSSFVLVACEIGTPYEPPISALAT